MIQMNITHEIVNQSQFSRLKIRKFRQKIAKFGKTSRPRRRRQAAAASEKYEVAIIVD